MKTLQNIGRALVCASLASLLFAPSTIHSQPGASAQAVTPSSSRPNRPDQVETFKVLAWNLEHFVDPFNDPYIDTAVEDTAKTKSDEVLANLISVLKEEDADILVFTEVESDRAVKLMLDSFWPEGGYQYFAGAPSLEWYQNVAIASRYPIGAITTFREKEMYNTVLGTWENKYNSRLLMAEIEVDEDYEVLVSALHLKAGSDPEDPVWRKAQIDMIQAFYEKEANYNSELNLVVTGDMNFTPDSPEYSILLNGGAVKLSDLFAPQGTAPTHPSRNPTRRIDHIFVNSNMAPEIVPNSVRVIQKEDIDTISDHLPVVSEFYAENR